MRLLMLGCRADALLRRPTPAFIYNFVQLTLAQAQTRLQIRPSAAPAKSVAGFVSLFFVALGQVGIGIGIGAARGAAC